MGGKLKLCIFWAFCVWQVWDDIRKQQENFNWHGTKGPWFWPLLLNFLCKHFLPLNLQCASPILILRGKVLLQEEELKLLWVLQSNLNKLLQLPLWPRCTFKQLWLERYIRWVSFHEITAHLSSQKAEKRLGDKSLLFLIGSARNHGWCVSW